MTTDWPYDIVTALQPAFSVAHDMHVLPYALLSLDDDDAYVVSGIAGKDPRILETAAWLETVEVVIAVYHAETPWSTVRRHRDLAAERATRALLEIEVDPPHRILMTARAPAGDHRGARREMERRYEITGDWTHRDVSQPLASLLWSLDWQFA